MIYLKNYDKTNRFKQGKKGEACLTAKWPNRLGLAPVWQGMLEISTHLLAQASVTTVGRVQVKHHSPGLASMIIISRIYYSKY